MIGAQNGSDSAEGGCFGAVGAILRSVSAERSGRIRRPNRSIVTISRLGRGRGEWVDAVSVDDGRHGLDLHELIVVAEDGHSEQSARYIVITERITHDLPRRH